MNAGGTALSAPSSSVLSGELRTVRPAGWHSAYAGSAPASRELTPATARSEGGGARSASPRLALPSDSLSTGIGVASSRMPGGGGVGAFAGSASGTGGGASAASAFFLLLPNLGNMDFFFFV